MLLHNWKQYLQKNNVLDTSNINDLNPWHGLTDYFSFANAVDSLNIYNNNSIILMPNIEYYTNLKINFTCENLLFSNANILESQFMNVNSSLVNKLSDLVFVKNDVLKIVNFLPNLSLNDSLEHLELWFYDMDNESMTQQELSTPDVKLYYPEPFIASPSFSHEEIWFIHILHYNYWLWFFFITLIMFYLITFINVVRWCNLRSKPKRETRGVSRSKCADLITACVPVSWAVSIIVSETVDATDYYDGFGTGEIVIGIRAYQWGWEYFYPKNIDLNYNVKSSFSTLVGNSIKYNNSNSKTLDSNSLWKHYQIKNVSNQVNVPAYVILSPNNTDSSLNNINFADVGVSVSKDSDAFKKIQKFSKLTTNNINSDIVNNNNVFKKLNNLYLTEGTLNTNSHAYGTKRQHNFSSLDSTLPAFSTLVDKKSFNQFFTYSLNLENQKKDVLLNITPYDVNYNSYLDSPRKFNTTYSRLVEGLLNNSNVFFTQWYKNYLNNFNLNNCTDSKKDKNFLLSFFKDNSTKKKFIKTHYSGNLVDELVTNNNTSFFTWNLFNESRNYRFKDIKSNNLQFLSPDKNYRSVANSEYSSTNRDLGLLNSNVAMQNENFNLGTNIFKNHISSISNWNNSSLLNKINKTNVTIIDSHNPIYSANTSWKNISFDRTDLNSNSDTPEILRSKEESAPTYMFNSYWSSYWKNISLHHNYELILNNIQSFQKFSLPLISEYVEYDFKNWQALESLEDAIWESSYSAFSHEDYVNIKKEYLEPVDFNKSQNSYNIVSRSSKDKFKYKSLYKSLSNMNVYANKINPLVFYTEDFFFNLSNINLLNFNNYNNEILFDGVEDSYENLKNLKYFYYNTYQNLLLNSQNSLLPVSYTTVLDSFRADFDENDWNLDQEYSLTNSNFTQNYKNLNVTNNLKIRSTAKNSIVNYNAIQKVYKSRFDEGRSNANFKDFSNSFTNYPFIIDSKSPYESMIGKNKESFFNTGLYQTTYQNNYSTLLDVWNSNNVIFSNIPFLLSMKSDSSRYLWFDWQSRWSSIEVQPSSIAKYSLAGLPYFSKTFEYSTQLGEELNDSENYLTKLSRARKNYMPNWAYSPYFYSKITNWFNYNFSDYFFNTLSTKNVKTLFSISSSYWESTSLLNNLKLSSTPTFSGLNVQNKVTWSPISGVQAHYYNTAILTDILSKRESLYRSFFKHKSSVIALPKSLTVSPNNFLLNEIKATYSFIDPANYSSEISRELLYQNTSFLKYTFLKDFIKLNNALLTQLPINFNLISNYFIHLFGVSDNYNSLAKNNDLYKSQYRPMRKGITNMIRLQATSAIAMPTEIRLHILASSKDVIHSWAIPSAGVKIDCVPGYSTHRVAIFLTHGIFWGQCMEICGRYHHWMPIVVYFMKRDLFFLWCTHFMHYSDAENSFNMTDKQLVDYLRLVSFDKTSWVNEINKYIN